MRPRIYPIAYCKICKKRLSRRNYQYCQKCWSSQYRGKNHWGYKNGLRCRYEKNYCKHCHAIIDLRATYCRKCWFNIIKKSSLHYQIRRNMKDRIKQAIKQNSKNSSTMILLGCSVDYLMYHLQEQFKKGMSWDNYGFYGWHIDHIIACYEFDLSKKREQKKCFHYTNLQPLWAKEHRIKTNKEIKRCIKKRKEEINEKEER